MPKPFATNRAMRSLLTSLFIASMLLSLQGCTSSPSRPDTVRFLIESSPNNLDLRQGTDAQSERIGALIYDPLVHRDASFHLTPWLASSWTQPDSTTWIFRLRPHVLFHDGHPLTSKDVAWSIRSLTNGALITSKAGAFAGLTRIETPDPLTLILHTKAPDASLLFNLSDGLFGVVEEGAGRDEGLHPIGTGAFRFVSQVQDKDVVLERNVSYWNGAPSIPRLIFDVTPDNITTALELKKRSADVESNAITLDEVHALQNVSGLTTLSVPSTTVIYAQFNVEDPALRDPRVRQAIAYALDKPALIQSLWRGQARAADTLLPPGHWARAASEELQQYPHSADQAKRLLDQAGLKPDASGVRLRFTLKTSTDETTRLLAQALQQQLAVAGIDMSIRPSEFGTFYADITKGAFQMYILRWTGASNLDPDIFRYAYASASMPPKGANRGHYYNAAVNALLAQAANTNDEPTRRAAYIAIQKILAKELPSIPLWYPNNEIIQTQRLSNLHPEADGSFSFLRTATLHASQ
ncbi:MAG: ABC transporter substrate-binding protein [Acidobacteriaceae bacterium]|nr:ABC transporter substrate-binding protein [Acidobacteriaceae bacterium]